MVNPVNRQSGNERNLEGMDRIDQSISDGIDDSSSVGASSSIGETSAIGSSGDSRQSRGSGTEIGLTDRLTDILVDDGDGDLLIQEDRVMQWLQALDMQVIGACRADERLKPFMKLNVSSGVADDCLLAHLSQHFEPSEVGILARCMCIPLVSIRVGKINKQGGLLCPTGSRGNLTLTLLPTSDLRISFIGDDGRMERLSTLSRDLHYFSVAIEGIPADRAGLSFLIKIPDGETFYFWCSEKSKLLGNELLDKMNDLLKRKPSVAELTGISESRLDCFATYLRAYLVGSMVMNTRASSVISTTPSSDTLVLSCELRQNAQFSSSSSLKLSRSRHYGSQGAKPNPFYQGSLSPRSNSFKEGLPRNLSSLRSVAREKFRRRGESHVSYVDNLSFASPTTRDAVGSSEREEDKITESIGTLIFPPSSCLESLGEFTHPPFLSPASQFPSMGGSSLFSPYYSWCPSVASTLQYTVAPPQLAISSTVSFSLPPLSSLLSSTQKPPLNRSEISSIGFPPFLPEPLVRLPLSRPTSQQIPTFTPLTCDPIVHIPVIDICSSGQGYLVSASPTMALVNPLIPETDSVLDKGARETLRLLLSSSSQASQQLVSVFPSFLTNGVETQSIVAAGSRGLYSGTRDNGISANSIAAMGLASLSERSMGSSVFGRCISQGDLVEQQEKPDGTGGTRSEGEERTD